MSQGTGHGWNKFYFRFYTLIFCSPVLGKVSLQSFPLGVWKALVRSRNRWLTCPSCSLSFLKIISSSCGGENPSQDRSQDNCSWKLSLQGIGMGFCGIPLPSKGWCQLGVTCIPAEMQSLAMWMLPLCSQCSSLTTCVNWFSFALQQIKFNSWVSADEQQPQLLQIRHLRLDLQPSEKLRNIIFYGIPQFLVQDEASLAVVGRFAPPARNSLLSPFHIPIIIWDHLNLIPSPTIKNLCITLLLPWHLDSCERQELYSNRNFANMVKKLVLPFHPRVQIF